MIPIDSFYILLITLVYNIIMLIIYFLYMYITIYYFSYINNTDTRILIAQNKILKVIISIICT